MLYVNVDVSCIIIWIWLYMEYNIIFVSNQLKIHIHGGHRTSVGAFWLGSEKKRTFQSPENNWPEQFADRW